MTITSSETFSGDGAKETRTSSLLNNLRPRSRPNLNDTLLSPIVDGWNTAPPKARRGPDRFPIVLAFMEAGAVVGAVRRSTDERIHGSSRSSRAGPILADRIRADGLGRHISEVVREAGVAQRVGPVSWIQSERFQRWLRAMNARKYNVFVSVNAIASGRRSRTRDAIGAVRHVFLDADHDGRAVLSRVEARRDLPSPSYILHSSPNHIHVFWRVSGFDPRRRRAVAEAACPRVADGSGSDAGDTEHSIARVLQPQASPATSRDDRVPQYEPPVQAGRFSTDRGRESMASIGGAAAAL